MTVSGSDRATLASSAKTSGRAGAFASLGFVPPGVLAATVLAILGISLIWPTAIVLWAMWVNDPLKSIGMLVPWVSLVLILRAWRGLAWRMQGSWWGLALLLGTSSAVIFREQSVLVLVLSPRWSIFFPPHSFVALVYVAGCVLLLGGPRLLRAARFPVLLTLLVNPVPHIFNVYVDLPLQRISAHVARAFALALHQKLSPDQMRLMFTPDFGMFIAPGCNGIRGAVTMGMLALVVGHLYRFRLRAHLLFVIGAILLGYLFNFVRLCTLVLYYILALKVPWLQDRAEMGDYVIGAALFLFAVYLLFLVVHRLGQPQTSVAPPMLQTLVSRTPRLPLAVMLLLVLAAGARQMHARRLALAESASQPIPIRFPAALGTFALDRTWNESMPAGPIIYTWAQYRPQTAPSTGSPAANAGSLPIDLGLSPLLGAHDTSICHSARGEDPIWHGELDAVTASGNQTFSASFFNNGATQYLEVTTLCTTSGCGERTAGASALGLIYSRPAPLSTLVVAAHRPVPVMLKIETLDTAMPADLARAQLIAGMRDFLKSLDLQAIAHPTA